MKPLLTLLALSALALPTDALACSCVPPQPVPEAVDDATRVFVGEVVDAERIDPLHRRVTFHATEHFKGSPVEKIQLTTASDGVMCGYPFNEGSTYVVYAYGEEGDLGTGSCSRTTLAIEGSDLEVLRAGK
ncbi:MAG TPA: hypothetical protein VFS99_04795 [Xanthomonadaceae bacterium]|nr:hypothetical protein [Xanthomonadaceae bacterium]